MPVRPEFAETTAVAYFQLISEWHLDAPIDRVWRALTHFTHLPTWWPSLELADRVHGSDEEVRDCVRGALGTTVRFTQHTELLRAPELMQFRVEGDLVGSGLLALLDEDDATRVMLSWNVDLTNPWFRALSRLPGMRAILARTHSQAMEEGERCLKAHLAKTTLRSVPLELLRGGELTR